MYTDETTPVNLQRRYPRYRFRLQDGWEEAHECSPDEISWYLTMECRYGEISLYDADSIFNVTVISKHMKTLIERLSAISESSLVAEGDFEAVFTIPMEYDREIFRVMKPHLNVKEAAKIRARLHGR